MKSNRIEIFGICLVFLLLVLAKPAFATSVEYTLEFDLSLDSSEEEFKIDEEAVQLWECGNESCADYLVWTPEDGEDSIEYQNGLLRFKSMKSIGTSPFSEYMRLVIESESGHSCKSNIFRRSEIPGYTYKYIARFGEGALQVEEKEWTLDTYVYGVALGVGVGLILKNLVSFGFIKLKKYPNKAFFYSLLSDAFWILGGLVLVKIYNALPLIHPRTGRLYDGIIIKDVLSQKGFVFVLLVIVAVIIVKYSLLYLSLRKSEKPRRIILLIVLDLVLLLLGFFVGGLFCPDTVNVSRVSHLYYYK